MKRRQPRRRTPKKAAPPPKIKSAHEQFTVEQIITAVKHARGMVAAAARSLGCIRQTIYDYRDRHPEVSQALEESKEFQLDLTELKLFQAIDKGEAWSICFYLKCHGRTRGYIERQDVKINGKVEGGVLYMPVPTNSSAEWAKQFEHAKQEHTA